MRYTNIAEVEIVVGDGGDYFISGTGMRAIIYRNRIARANLYVCGQHEFYKEFEYVSETAG